MTPLRNLCEREGLVFQAYASLGAGALGLLEHETVRRVAETHDVSPAQVRQFSTSCEIYRIHLCLSRFS